MTVDMITKAQNQTATAPEEVRLLIWDLDDTFWSGTLTEGGIETIERNVVIVKTLAERGIVSSICSKNDLAKVKAKLERIGLWDYFTFCRVAWEGKGAMVRNIIESSQLRPATIMFIDDNPINLNEVRHYNPEIQLADPNFLKVLLDDPRFTGKDDKELTRLAQYKVLEKKEQDQAQYADSNTEFLRNSDIRISLHHDVLNNFARVHELINRTNQLNYTKKRVSEDAAEAYAQIEKLLDTPWTRASYIKVSDKYGDYGVVGFFMVVVPPRSSWTLEHFLFSCRILNMGIEQFIYQRMKKPKFDIVGEVVADLNTNVDIDWITIVEDAGQRGDISASQVKRLCLRGACDLHQLTHYLGHTFPIQTEFPFPFKGTMVAVSAPHCASIYEALSAPEHARFFKDLPFIHPRILNTALLSGEADVFIQSFAAEEQWIYFKYKPTGLTMPFRMATQAKIPAAELTKLPFEDVDKFAQMKFSADGWRWFQENFEFAGGYDAARFEAGLHDLFKRLAGKEIILILSNTRHGGDRKGLLHNTAMNAIVERVGKQYGARFIKLDDLIMNGQEVRDAIHIRRPVFPRLADKLKEMLQTSAG